MRNVRYVVAASLDRYVAGPKGEADWILMEPDIDFAELWAQFDTLLMGRKTYDAAKSRLGETFMQGMKTVVVSRTLSPADNPNLTVLSNLTRDRVQSLQSQSTKDIRLCGGGELFRSMLALHEIDTVEVTIMPVRLDGGVALLLPPAQRTALKLSGHRNYRSGILSLIYDVQRLL